MLDDRITDMLVERLVNRIEQGNTYVLKQIGKSIKKVGSLTPVKAKQLINVFKYGGNYDKIVNKLAEITALNVNDIYEIFREVARIDYEFAEQFYKYRNLKYIPFEENVDLQNQIKALSRIAARDYINLSNTLAFSKKVNGKIVYTELSKMYQDVIDEAVIAVGQGKDTFNQQMRRVIKQLGESGIRTVEYGSGYSRRLDSAVRMNLKGAIANLHNEIQNEIGRRIRADGVEISVHSNPAPDHEEIQGRQFSKEQYELLQNTGIAQDYTGKWFDITNPEQKNGTFHRPIGDFNCYHYKFDIVLGVNQPNYTEQQLQEIIDNNNKGFEFDGVHYTNYEGTQLQRRIETEIRKQKDIQIAAVSSYDDSKPNEQNDIKDLIVETQTKITQLTRKYKQLSDVSGIPTKMERLTVSGYKRVSVAKL